MKIYNKRHVTIIALCGLLIGSCCLQAKVKAVMARRDFEQILAKDSMVVVLFYEDQKGNSEMRNQNKGLTRMYEDLSAYQPYDDADVIFLKVNTGRKDLADLALLYGVKTMPIFIFFNNGKHLVDDKGLPIVLNGFATREEVQSLINTYYGAEIKRYVKEKEARRSERFKEENESWKPYFYPADIYQVK